MTRKTSSHLGPSVFIIGLLVGLAAWSASFNASGQPPRSVFSMLPAEYADPKIQLSVTQSANGISLVIKTTGFQFTDICVADAAPGPVGHAHIIVNGTKMASTYGPWIELPPLPPGRHTVSVVLRSQDHRALFGRAGIIKADHVLDVADSADSWVAHAGPS